MRILADPLWPALLALFAGNLLTAGTPAPRVNPQTTLPPANLFFEIQVVDDQTHRGIPLVELETVNHLRYITDTNGFSRPMCRLGVDRGPIWAVGFMTVPDTTGRDRLVCHYAHMESLEKMIGHGLAIFDDAKEEFEKVASLDLKDLWRFPPQAHPVRHSKHGLDYFYLGEVWYSEAPELTGPWLKARKIVSHHRYSFYNPVHHPFFDQAEQRLIHFEGTYVNTFSGNPDTTPRYDYNQIMYRLDLSDPRLDALHQ